MSIHGAFEVRHVDQAETSLTQLPVDKTIFGPRGLLRES